MSKWFKKLVEVLPIAMLLVTALTGYLSSQGWYFKVFAFLPDLLGYSIFTNIGFLFLYWRPQFCIPTKISVVGLLVMNLISILLKAYEMKTGDTSMYNYLYDVYITLLVFIVVLFYKFKRF